VFVTNEDDGSAPPSTKIYENDVAAGAPHGAYDTYRQTRYGIACGAPLAGPPYAASVGPLLGCEPAPDLAGEMIGEEYDVSRYTTLFTQPKKRGGIKRDPTNQVIVVGLDGPHEPVQIVTVRASSGTGVPPDVAYVSCSPVDGVNCLVRVQHSCQNIVQPAFFADPAVRLHDVIASVGRKGFESSICGEDITKTPDFSQVLGDVAKAIGQGLQPACIPAILSDSEHPDCVVEDVVVDDNGNDQITEIPRCDLAMGRFPCWRVEDKAACKDSSPQSLGVTIDRNGADPPADAAQRVFCSTVAN